MTFPALNRAYNFFFLLLLKYPNTRRVGPVTPCKKLKPTSKSLLVRSLYRMVISHDKKECHVQVKVDHAGHGSNRQK